jgi:hypothetical protein
MAEQIKRQIAYKARVCDILSGEYVKRSGWEPNYLMTPLGDLSRVNLIAFIVSIDSQEGTIMVDDGTGSVPLRFFDANADLSSFGVGDLVQIIARPKEWNNEKYLVPEIVKRLSEQKWLAVRQLELRLHKKIGVPKKDPAAAEPGAVSENKEVGPYQKILNLIERLDKGEGASTEDIVTISKVKDAEKIIETLIEEGEIFQIKPGKLKILG